jgi:hypothetical protein
MAKPSGSSLGSALGSIAVVVGILYLGLGFASAYKGQSQDGVEGLLFGGLALVAGCVILHRRGKARNKQTEPSPAEQSAPADQPRD